MKKYRAFLLGVLVTMLASTLFWAGTAYASTGCFPDTNGYWAESFICWLKEHGITVGYADGTFKPNNSITRGEMAVMLQRASNVPPTTGEIRINSGPNSWEEYSATPPETITTLRLDDYVEFTNSFANSTRNFVMTSEFPSALYGRNLSVSGMEYCYSASPNAYVDALLVRHFQETQGAVASFTTLLVSDFTNRTDSTCRYYSFTPAALDDTTLISVIVGVSWGPSGAGAHIRLGRVTFFLQPTDTPVIAP